MGLWLQNGGNKNCFILNMKKHQRSRTNCFRIDGEWLCICITEKPSHLCSEEPAGEPRGWHFSRQFSVLLRLIPVLQSGKICQILAMALDHQARTHGEVRGYLKKLEVFKSARTDLLQLIFSPQGLPDTIVPASNNCLWEHSEERWYPRRMAHSNRNNSWLEAGLAIPNAFLKTGTRFWLLQTLIFQSVNIEKLCYKQSGINGNTQAYPEMWKIGISHLKFWKLNQPMEAGQTSTAYMTVYCRAHCISLLCILAFSRAKTVTVWSNIAISLSCQL